MSSHAQETSWSAFIFMLVRVRTGQLCFQAWLSPNLIMLYFLPCIRGCLVFGERSIFILELPKWCATSYYTLYGFAIWVSAHVSSSFFTVLWDLLMPRSVLLLDPARKRSCAALSSSSSLSPTWISQQVTGSPCQQPPYFALSMSLDDFQRRGAWIKTNSMYTPFFSCLLHTRSRRLLSTSW